MIIYTVKEPGGCDSCDREDISGYFSTAEGAYHYINHRPRYRYEVEEHEVDECLESLPPIDPAWEIGPVYEATMDMKSNVISSNANAFQTRLRHPTEAVIEHKTTHQTTYARSPISAAHAEKALYDLTPETMSDCLDKLNRLTEQIAIHLCCKPFPLHTSATFYKGWKLSMKGRQNEGILTWSFKDGFELSIGSSKSHTRSSSEILALIQALI